MSDLPYNKAAARVSNPVTRKARGILKLHTSLRKGTVYKADASYTPPSKDKEKKSGSLEKLSSNGDNCWIPVTGILAAELFYFSPNDKLHMSDCIPVAEICDVKAFDDTADINLKASEIGPAWSKSFNNLDRLANARMRDTYPFVLYTVDKGYNGGRSYFLRANSEEERISWIEAIAERVSTVYEAALTDRSKFRRIRYVGRKIYEHDISQKVVALLIFSNFLLNCLDAQIQPDEGSPLSNQFVQLDIAFTSIFAFELSVNMFLHWFWPFWTGPDWQWNVFDFFVVLTAVLSLSIQKLQTFSLLRTVRAFRVFRLFRRLKTLALLMLSFSKSIRPIISCLVVLFLVTCIYSIMGIDLFRDSEPDLFGSLPKAIFTVTCRIKWISCLQLIRVLFGTDVSDGNAGQLVRNCIMLWKGKELFFTEFLAGLKDWFVPLQIENTTWRYSEKLSCHFFFTDSSSANFQKVYFFFGTFAVIGGMVLMTVFFAVLLDEFSRSYIAEKHRITHKKEMQQSHDELTWPLDPIIEALLLFENELQLESMITQIFQLLDKNASGWVNYDKFQKGLKQLQSKTTIHISKDEYDFLANMYAANRRKKFDAKTFSDMIHHQLLLYSNRCLTRKHQNINTAATQHVTFNAVKLLTLQVARISMRGIQDRDVLADFDETDATEARRLFEGETKQRLDAIDARLTDFTATIADKFHAIDKLIDTLEGHDFDHDGEHAAAKGSHESAVNPVDSPYKATQSHEANGMANSKPAPAAGGNIPLPTAELNSLLASLVRSGSPFSSHDRRDRSGLDTLLLPGAAAALPGTGSRDSHAVPPFVAAGGSGRGGEGWPTPVPPLKGTKILKLRKPLRQENPRGPGRGSDMKNSGGVGRSDFSLPPGLHRAAASSSAAEHQGLGNGTGRASPGRNLYMGEVEHHENGPYLMTVNLHDLQRDADDSSDEMAML